MDTNQRISDRWPNLPLWVPDVVITRLEALRGDFESGNITTYDAAHEMIFSEWPQTEIWTWFLAHSDAFNWLKNVWMADQYAYAVHGEMEANKRAKVYNQERKYLDGEFLPGMVDSAYSYFLWAHLEPHMP